MDKTLLTSRFFTKDDNRMEKVVFPLPSHWWSRFYEYAWAAEFCKETDVVLDAACGIPHPFKLYLAEKCKDTHAVDIDGRILEPEAIAEEICKTFGEDAKLQYLRNLTDTVQCRDASLTKLPYKNNMFDKIFSISALEHIPDVDKNKSLSEFCRVLKKSGQIILTLDYPDTNMEQIETMANEAGLKLAGDKDNTLPPNAINWNNSLYCFRMVFVKIKDGE